MKNFIICDSCKSKIEIGEDVEVSNGVGRESYYYCKRCFCLQEKLSQEYLDDFWENRYEDDYDWDEIEEDDEVCDSCGNSDSTLIECPNGERKCQDCIDNDC